MFGWLLHHLLDVFSWGVPLLGWGFNRRHFVSRARPRRSVFSGVRTTAHARVGRRVSRPTRRVYSTPRRQPSVRHGYHPRPSERTSFAQSAPRRAAVQARQTAINTLNQRMANFGSSRGFAQFPISPTPFATFRPNPHALRNIARGSIMLGNINAGALSSASKQADALWKTARRFYGGKQPRLDVNQLPRNILGNAFLGSNKINVSRDLAVAASGANPRTRATMANVLLHEWTHTRQPMGHDYARTPLIEGGADDYAHYVADALKIKHDPGYAHYIDFVNKHLGRNWIRKGQFMGP